MAIRIPRIFSAMVLCCLAAGLLPACDDDGATPREETFSLEVVVLDPAGAPRPGVRVSAYSLLPATVTQDGRKDGAKAVTAVSFDVPRECRVLITIHDVSGSRVHTLSDEIRPAGVHRLHWAGLFDSEDFPAAPVAGPYRIVMEAFDTVSGESAFLDEVCAVMYLPDSDQMVMGYTDERGVLRFHDKRWFPHLYDLDGMSPFAQVDETGQVIGSFEYTGMVRITVCDTALGGCDSFDRELTAGANRISLTLDLKDDAAEMPVAGRERAATVARDDPEIPPLRFELHPNYPNPFN